ncbi:hypothetical protein MKZ38_006104 [Zalerion maritima]|uniref:DUF5672 domain-containing protein n=1 Tax=Zalerion maritima TaxID=339359 RepID=A0AAD5RWN6_9PEZI|nr:hypothetical protein MKZ38_006104 [Zalerion maritima]
MGAPLQTHGQRPFALTKGKIFILVSLAFTYVHRLGINLMCVVPRQQQLTYQYRWWFAHMLPHYKPAIKSAVTTRLQEARQKIPSIHVDWHRDQNPRANYNSSKVALLLEPRYLPHLVPLILHMIYVAPPDWRFVFIGSEKSRTAVGRSFAIKHQQVVGKLDLMTLPKPWDISSKEMVHRLMTDMRFYDEFLPGVEWILKYEADSILCANSGSSLNDWLSWSWAGAPRTLEDRFSGNGGLSLRRVSAIRRVLGFQERFNDSSAEDEWFGHRLWTLPGEKVASGTNGALAVENVYFEKPMGYHIQDGGSNLKDEVWGQRAQRQEIFSYCPELSMIMDMKLERERCPGDRGDGTLNDNGILVGNQKVGDDVKKAEEEARLKAEAETKQKATEEVQKAEAEAKQKAAEEAKQESKGKSENKAVEDTPEDDPELDDQTNALLPGQEKKRPDNGPGSTVLEPSASPTKKAVDTSSGPQADFSTGPNPWPALGSKTSSNGYTEAAPASSNPTAIQPA